MTTHYALLGISPTAGTEDVRRAFRREVARYHPDKVQHLGLEFQDMATARTAALTEAYTTLVDEELRKRYDEQLSTAAFAAPSRSPIPSPPRDPRPAPVDPERRRDVESRQDSAACRVSAADPGAVEVLKRAVITRLNRAVSALGGATCTSADFDAVYTFRGKRGFLRGSQPGARVAARVVRRVDGASVQGAWLAAARAPAEGETPCLMLLGSELAPVRELAGSVADLRRRTRGVPPLLVAVDIRDWQALLPPDAPLAVRSLVESVRRGE